MNHIAEVSHPIEVEALAHRSAERRSVTVPARLAWRDRRGVNRFASVVTRDVSDHGVFVESQSSLSIPLYRLVQFQVEASVRDVNLLPEPLRRGRVLSAVYRVSHATKPGERFGVALRLMVDPKRRAIDQTERIVATA
jgi:hypothetical protein